MARSGILRVTSETNDSKVSDDYDYMGDTDKETSVVFDVNHLDKNADSVAETLDMTVKSSMPNDDVTELRYTVKIIK